MNTDAKGAYPSMGVTAHREVVQIELHLTPGQANDLYNEVYCLFRDRGVSSAHDRHRFHAPALYALYDALYSGGIDGSGASSNADPRSEYRDPEEHAYDGDGTSRCSCGYPMNAHGAT